MRLTLALLVCAFPAAGWEFSSTPICTLTGPQTTVTYDASGPLYTITVTNPDGWPASPTFGISFLGASPLSIGTDRHVIDGPDLSVSDTGFGNVIVGLARNDTALAQAGDTAVTIPLAGIAEPLAAFLNCPADALS